MRTFSRRYLGWAFVLVLTGALVVWVVTPMVARTPAPRIGGAAPDFTLESTEGQKVSLGALRGKPTVVVFVASWCDVCRKEMPTMIETFRAHQEHEVVFLGVDVYEDYLVAQQFREEFEMPFPLLVDAYGQVMTQYRVNGTPTTFFIDRQGIIRDVVVGGPLDRAYLDKEIDPLLGVATRKCYSSTSPAACEEDSIASDSRRLKWLSARVARNIPAATNTIVAPDATSMR